MNNYEKNLRKRLYVWLRVRGLEYIINKYYHINCGKSYDPINVLDKELNKCGEYYKDFAYYFKNWPNNEPRQIVYKQLHNGVNDNIEIELKFRTNDSKYKWEGVYKDRFIDNMIDKILDTNTNDYIDLFKEFIKESSEFKW